MIIDCHAHVFQHWAGACGHGSSEVHRRYMQKVQTRTVARIIRARDGKVVSGEGLFTPGRNGWSGLKDVEFRVGNYGRFDFTIDSEDYHSQYMPVAMQEIVAPPELMLAQMQYAGVDRCVLQAGGGYGAMNDYNAFAQNQYPDKFFALLNVDEPRAYTDAGLREFDRAVNTLGLKGVYFGLNPTPATTSTSLSTMRAWTRSGRRWMLRACRCSSRFRQFPTTTGPVPLPTSCA